MDYQQRRPRKGLAIILIITGIILVGWFYRAPIKDWWERRDIEPVPEAVDKDMAVKPDDILDNIGPVNANIKVEEPEPEPEALPVEYNLAMSFTTQAPHANWNLPYQEACEEASVAMVHYYWSDQEFNSPELADDELLMLVDFQTKTYGDYKDTTAEETARLIRDYYEYENVDVIKDPTVEQIKREVADGYPVIVPAYGKTLENPNFRSGGPLYHMLVIKGYTADTFITNDPGTRKGADFIYSINNIMESMGDWNDGDPANGDKVVIVVRNQ
ncbi:C39 family peptidase [Patescibacteria group bacterium]